MNGFERERLLGVLTLLVMALFVSGGFAMDARWRRGVRLATIAAFVLAVAAAVVEIALWLIDSGSR